MSETQPETISDTRIAELLAMEAKATPGPWRKDFGSTYGHIKSTADDDECRTPTVLRYDLAASSISPESRQANGFLIAALRNDARPILCELQRLRARIDSNNQAVIFTADQAGEQVLRLGKEAMEARVEVARLEAENRELRNECVSAAQLASERLQAAEERAADAVEKSRVASVEISRWVNEASESSDVARRAAKERDEIRERNYTLESNEMATKDVLQLVDCAFDALYNDDGSLCSPAWNRVGLLLKKMGLKTMSDLPNTKPNKDSRFKAGDKQRVKELEAREKKPFVLNISSEWLKEKAAQEDGECVSAGGWVAKVNEAETRKKEAMERFEEWSRDEIFLRHSGWLDVESAKLGYLEGRASVQGEVDRLKTQLFMSERFRLKDGLAKLDGLADVCRERDCLREAIATKDAEIARLRAELAREKGA